MVKKKINLVLIIVNLIFLISIPIFISINPASFSTNTSINNSSIAYTTPDKSALIWGMGASPPYIDPTDSWDSQANVVIRQCTESLWWYNYSDPDEYRLPYDTDDIDYDWEIKMG